MQDGLLVSPAQTRRYISRLVALHNNMSTHLEPLILLPSQPCDTPIARYSPRGQYTVAHIGLPNQSIHRATKCDAPGRLKVRIC